MENYVNIRELLACYIGKTIGDISQHDEGDYNPETGEGSFIMLLFTDGCTLKFPVGHQAVEAEDATDD